MVIAQQSYKKYPTVRLNLDAAEIKRLQHLLLDEGLSMSQFFSRYAKKYLQQKANANNDNHGTHQSSAK